MNIIVIAAMVLMSSVAFAFPINQPYDLGFIDTTNIDKYDFEGIVSLSNCSGSIVKFEGMTDDQAAYVMTNGHCLEGGMPKPNEVVYKKNSRRSFTVLDSDARGIGRITSTEVTYGTMTNTDLAFYRVSETYNQIYEKFKTRPLILDRFRPMIGDSLEIISGSWKRGYSCGLDAFIPTLKEGSWFFRDSIRYTSVGCQVIGGTSGSPIIKAGTRIAIGVNNTGNEGGKACSVNNPCEIYDDGAPISIPKASYGQQIYQAYTCLDESFDFDLSLDTCQLPK